MAFYGLIRGSVRHKHSPERVMREMQSKAEELGGVLARVFIEPLVAGRRVALVDTAAGRDMVATIKAGDTLIVSSFDQLGYSMQDVRKTAELLVKRRVQLAVLDLRNGGVPIPPDTIEAFLAVFGFQDATQKALLSEHLQESAQVRRASGRPYGGVPMGKRIVERNGVKYLEWDMDQLAIIAEIAKRLPKEGAQAVAKDFWRRRVRDRHGNLWGKQRKRPQSRQRQILSLFRAVARGRRIDLHESPYEQFHKAARWFHRMKHLGELPEPYGSLAASLPDPKGFRMVPDPKKWTRGGAAKRDKERAERKAQNKAKRLAKYQAEKEARIAARIHKSVVIKEGLTPPPSERLNNDMGGSQ